MGFTYYSVALTCLILFKKINSRYYVGNMGFVQSTYKCNCLLYYYFVEPVGLFLINMCIVYCS